MSSAIAQAKAFPGAASRSLQVRWGGQALAAGLVDEVRMGVVPVIFGSGRKFFGSYDGGQLMLEDPRTIQGNRVSHVIYAVRQK